MPRDGRGGLLSGVEEYLGIFTRPIYCLIVDSLFMNV